MAGNELVTKSFANQCLAFPDRVDQMLAEIETVEEAKGMLDQAATMQHYAERLKAGVEVERPIAIGVLKIKAKLGELLPAKPPAERGQGRGGNKSTQPALVDFTAPTIAAYRKLAAHRDLLEDYVESVDDVPTQTDFLKTLTLLQRNAKESAREAKRQENAVKARSAKDLADVVGQFATIVADPPWDWGDEGDVNQMGRAKADFATMPFADILALPVEDRADADCHLYLWITNRSLPKGFALIEEWGFRYVSCLTWCKPSFGMGNYFRGSTEHVLFAVRGSQALKRKDVGTWHEWPRPAKKHSAKPPEFLELVESCSPGPYLELFARSKRDGWISWGADA